MKKNIKNAIIFGVIISILTILINQSSIKELLSLIIIIMVSSQFFKSRTK